MLASPIKNAAHRSAPQSASGVGLGEITVEQKNGLAGVQCG
ncbi:hypothetical protein PATSB16_04380 [Pandoraea thiooxydans]|nr:hypothetical protein PATSB16_04380 [Pandoraea thiooxydans]